MYYGHYNEKGEYLGFYSDDIHQEIPEPNLELTEKEWQQAINGSYKVIKGVHKKFRRAGATDETLLKTIRNERDNFLAKSDFSQFADVNFSDDKKQEWREYRQALRDMMNDCDPQNPIYPQKPN
jgi:hypothetical protein